MLMTLIHSEYRVNIV